jgi:hypothetical protein
LTVEVSVEQHPHFSSATTGLRSPLRLRAAAASGPARMRSG